MGTAFKYLERRQMTAFQLETKLKAKGFEPEEIEETLLKLKSWNYVNDDNYAREYCRIKSDKYSRMFIRFELLKSGIDKEIVELVLNQMYSEEKELENCKRIACQIFSEEANKWEKKYKNQKTYQNIPREILLKKKTGEKLLKKGYNYSIVKRVCEFIN